MRKLFSANSHRLDPLGNKSQITPDDTELAEFLRNDPFADFFIVKQATKRVVEDRKLKSAPSAKPSSNLPPTAGLSY